MDTQHPAERRDRDPHHPIVVDLRDHLLAAAEQYDRARRRQGFLGRASAVFRELGAAADKCLAGARGSGRAA
jgi:hypothetical protein